LFGTTHLAEAATNTYIVKKGDTLSKIAKTYHTSVNTIKKQNRLTSDFIKINEKLIISNDPLKPSKTITVNSSAYSLSGFTSTGINLRKNPNIKLISVDPKVIKLGTKVYVPGYGIAIAGDTGGSIKGNKIDIFTLN
jgi:3D (Asp-Asp-Asp) domain-containing protein